MKTLLKFISLILVLGTFMLPKAEIMSIDFGTSECCSTSKKQDSKECCSSGNKSSHDNKDSQTHHCTDNCCTHCTTCNIHIVVLSKLPIFTYNLYSPEETSLGNFAYITPNFSQKLKEIWQPPKILS